MATRKRRKKSSGRCKFGRKADGYCRKRPKARRRTGGAKRRSGCKRIRLAGRMQKMCWSARKKRYLFAS